MKIHKRSLPKISPPTNVGNNVTVVCRSMSFKYHNFKQIKQDLNTPESSNLIIFVSHLTFNV